MPSVTLCRNSCALLIAIAVMSACLPDSGNSTTVSPFDFSGRYQVTETFEPGLCSPAQLPALMSWDSTAYVLIPTNVRAMEVQIQVHQAGSQLLIVPLDSHGQEDSTLASVGTIAFGTSGLTGNITVSRTAALRMEGPRENGHTFTVSEQSLASGTYLKIPGPSSQLVVPALLGGDATVQAQSSETDTYTFRDGGASGAVFTTCAVEVRLFGNRVPG